MIQIFFGIFLNYLFLKLDLEQPFVTQQLRLQLVVTRVSQTWLVVLQVQQELALVTRHGVGIRQQTHANARTLCIIYLDHRAVRKKLNQIIENHFKTQLL